MACISHLDFIKKGLYDLTLNINPSYDSFELHLGKYFEDSESSCELSETGVSFSGSNGFIFDQRGNFFGGYTPNERFSIQINKKDYDSFSYSFNNKLIANNMFFEDDAINAIKFENQELSNLEYVIKSHDKGFVAAGTFGEFVEDNLENRLYSSDNILLISHL
jgi:hypothetical protein